MNKQIVLTICLIFQLTVHAQYNHEEFFAFCKNQNVEYLEFCFTDFLGNRKSILRPAQFLQKDLKRGLSFDGSSIAGCTRITQSDMLLIPDSFISPYFLPWITNHNSMRIFCTMHNDTQTPYESDPRNILKRELKSINDLGYDFLVGPELEFYIFNNNENNTLEPLDHKSYADTCDEQSIMNALISALDTLSSMNLNVEKIHHEVGEGQFEISLQCDNALLITDALLMTKDALTFIAQKYNKKISFMPKPMTGKPGNGMHLNFSLYDIKNKRNAFYDKQNPYKLSPIAQSFIAGVLKHACEITLLLNCEINSYKRLVKGYEAPIFICCGQKNRSALIRLPDCDDEYPELVRAEIRSPDAMCNPYLACAALIRAGREGIEKKYSLPPVVSENLYTVDEQMLKDNNIDALPQSLEEALFHFENSNLMLDLLGEKLFKLYCNQKHKEIRNSGLNVTDWELKTYQKH